MRLLVAAGAAAAALLVIGLAGIMTGHPALLPTLLRGAAGSSFAVQGTLLKSIPLLLTGLAVVIAFRGGVWNIGGEGQFLVGSIAAYLASDLGIAASLIAAAMAGATWAGIAVAMRLWRGAPEVLTTILLNFIAIHLLGYCVNGPLQEARAMYPQTESIPAHAVLPPLPATTVHCGLAIALAITLAAWWLLERTATGLRLTAMGHNPAAARSAGIDVRKHLALAMLLSGATAGIAGGIELLGITERLFERFAAGYGYSGIATALLAQLHPLGTIASAIFFGALATGAGELQRSAGISSAVATLAQAVVILILIAIGGAWRSGERLRLPSLFRFPRRGRSR